MRPFTRISTVLALLLAALVANLSWIQVLDADALRARDGNTRTVLEQFNRARGPIIVGSDPIATSSRSANDGFYQRSYTDGPLYAAVTGYYSMLYGATGVERSENGVLGGTDSRLFVDRIQQLFAGSTRAGGAVTLSVNDAAQRAAFVALAGKRGALVALDARTGAVEALVSRPSFDPQRLAPNDPAQVRATYEQLSADPAKPLLNRAVGAAYALGSPFELVTAAAALAAGRAKASSPLVAGSSFGAGSNTVRNPAGSACDTAGSVSLQRALLSHCATAFAWLGTQLGADAVRSTARQFGFDSVPSAQTSVVASRFPAGSTSIAPASIGEAGVRATVLQLALIAAAVANDGTLMNPYLVTDVRARNLAIIDHAVPTVRATPLSRSAAQQLQAMLLGVDGRTNCAECTIGGFPLHALTGTPQAGGPSWVVAFAGDVAVAAMIEDPSATRDATHAATSVLQVLLATS